MVNLFPSVIIDWLIMAARVHLYPNELVLGPFKELIDEVIGLRVRLLMAAWSK
jgi:hypothetical protein